MLNEAIQMSDRAQVTVDRARDDKLTAFGKATLTDRYLMPGESYQDLFARVSSYYADDTEHANRLYDYISRLWFMPATPVLSNGGTDRGLPISCFL
ncbi:MAG: ribonucleotide reductase N-terminal alpha domain-containing protein, partial [Pseudomonadota bacterium]